MKSLLKIRKILKTRKPKFIREGFHKKIGTKKKWKNPRGRRSTVGLECKGRRKRPKIGYGSPKEVKGLSREGLEFVNVSNVKDLQGLKSDVHTIVINSSVGLKKQTEIVKEAAKLKLTIDNFKNPDKYVGDRLKELQEKKKIKVAKVASKKKKTVKKEEKTEKKLEDALEDDKKDEEKKEKDKVLIKPR
jgi:large subunit ribosomal protein L32e